MQKSLLLSLLLLFLFSCSTNSQRDLASKYSGEKTEAYMSPHEGRYAFTKMYDLIREAKTDVNITVYSWSDSGFTKAMHDALDKKNPPILRVVLKKDLFTKNKKTIEELERKGAIFKKAKIDLHEKFVLADGKRLVNSSANMSGGARSRYSENFVFFDAEGAKEGSDLHSLLNDFKQEFAVIWNSGHDFITEGEMYKPDILNNNLKPTNKPSENKTLTLYSSSMNYKIGKPSKRDALKGSVIGLSRIPNKKNQIWTVKDQIIKAVKEAKKNIFLNINHFNLREISDELIKASERGIDVKLVVDSQEFRTYTNDKEMTPQFVEDWHRVYGKNSEAPVRVKFYSFYPHFSTWYLDHHKYMLIDYDEENPSMTKLLTGSYNYSGTAEHGKFDNQVLFESEKYAHIYKAFYEEFQNLWNLERDKSDHISQDDLDYYTTARNSLIPIHSSKPISLTWKEATDLKELLHKNIAESRNFHRYKHCYFYNIKKKVYIARDAKSVCK